MYYTAPSETENHSFYDMGIDSRNTVAIFDGLVAITRMKTFLPFQNLTLTLSFDTT